MRRVVHKHKEFKDSDVESEEEDDDDEHSRGREGHLPLTTRQAVLAKCRRVISRFTWCVPDFSVVLLAVI